MYFTYDTSTRYYCHCVQYWIYGYYSSWGYATERNDDAYKLRSELGVSHTVQITVEEDYFCYIFNIDTAKIQTISGEYGFLAF